MSCREYKNWCPIFYQKSKKLAYIGTINYLMALTSDTKKVIAKFKCKGMPKSMCFAPETGKLILLTEEETSQGDIHYLYSIDIENYQFHEAGDKINCFDNLKGVKDKVLIASDGKKLCKFDLIT